MLLAFCPRLFISHIDLITLITRAASWLFASLSLCLSLSFASRVMNNSFLESISAILADSPFLFSYCYSKGGGGGGRVTFLHFFLFFHSLFLLAGCACNVHTATSRTTPLFFFFNIPPSTFFCFGTTGFLSSFFFLSSQEKNGGGGEGQMSEKEMDLYYFGAHVLSGAPHLATDKSISRGNYSR